MTIGIGEVLIGLLILALVFGTGRLRFAGKELGLAVKELKSGFKDKEPQKRDDEAGSAS